MIFSVFFIILLIVAIYLAYKTPELKTEVLFYAAFVATVVIIGILLSTLALASPNTITKIKYTLNPITQKPDYFSVCYYNGDFIPEFIPIKKTDYYPNSEEYKILLEREHLNKVN